MVKRFILLLQQPEICPNPSGQPSRGARLGKYPAHGKNGRVFRSRLSCCSADHFGVTRAGRIVGISHDDPIRYDLRLEDGAIIPTFRNRPSGA
jgi:hypothetical protein